MPASTVSLILGAVAVVLAVGVVVLLVLLRRARERVSAAAKRGERDRIELELTLAEQTGRLTMVGELHELVGITLGRLAERADGISVTVAKDPAAASRAAAHLAQSAREAQGDLRRSAQLARDGALDAAELGPTPSLDDLDRLYEALRHDGLSVRVDETGERFALRAGAELAIYRIVQEGLENALEHGGEGTSVVLTMRWTDTGLALLIDDDGTAAQLTRAGQDPLKAAQLRHYDAADDLAALVDEPYGRGLTEIRERASLFGGVVSVTPVPGVGFSLQIAFPELKHHNGVHGVPLR